MQRLKAMKDGDGEWDDRIDWNENDGVDSRIPSDKEILAESIHVSGSGTKWRTLTAFADHTTFHALYYVFGSGHHPARRVIWAVLIFITVLFFSIQVSGLVSFYSMYAHYSTVSVLRDKEMKFPAVSICNLNGMKASVMNGTELDKSLREKYTWYKSRGFLNGTMVDIDKAAKHDLDDMLLSCGFYRKRCSPKNFTSFTYLFTDNCFTFNSGEEGHAIIKQRSPGRYQGLRLRLNIEHEEYYFGARAAGIRIFVHQQGDVPLQTSGHLVAPGTSNHFIVTRKQMKRLPPPYPSGCREDQLQHHKTYTLQNCWIESISKRVVSSCGCKAAFMKGNARLCTRRDMFRCGYKVYRKYREDDTFEKECPMPCDHERFQVATSSALYPSKSSVNSISKSMNLTGSEEQKLKYLRENVLEVYVFYDDFFYEEYEEHPFIKGYQLAAIILGMIIWYFGVNNFTIYEFFDFIVMVIVRQILKRRRTSNYPSRM